MECTINARFEFHADDAKRPEVDGFIAVTFDDYSREKIGTDEGFFEWGFEARDESDRVVGVIRGDAFVGGLLIHHLVVARDHRRSGLGSHLLGLALRLGIERGLSIARLTSFEYQAPSFYLRHGFQLDFSRTTGFNPDAGALHYFSRPLRPADVDVLPGSAATAGVGGTSFLTRSGSCLSVRVIPDDARVAAHDSALEMLKEYAIETTGGQFADVQPFCFVARQRTPALAPATTSASDRIDSDHAPPCPTVTSPSPSPQAIVGVVCGITFWGGAEIEILVVSPELRRSGLGSALLACAEAHVSRAGAEVVCLQTFNFQVSLLAQAVESTVHAPTSGSIEVLSFIVSSLSLAGTVVLPQARIRSRSRAGGLGEGLKLALLPQEPRCMHRRRRCELVGCRLRQAHEDVKVATGCTP